MTPLTVTPDCALTPWTDCKGVPFGRIVRIGRLSEGMQSGAASVTVLIELPDGQRIMAETSLKLLVSAVAILKAVDEATGSVPGNVFCVDEHA